MSVSDHEPGDPAVQQSRRIALNEDWAATTVRRPGAQPWQLRVAEHDGVVVGASFTILDSQVYGAPPTMQQRDGPTPLKDLIKSKLAPAALGVPSTSEKLNLLNSNDDRMNQTVFVSGKIWGALNTVVKSPTGAARTAIAWFSVAPSWDGITLGGSIATQGYVAVTNNSVAFPAVAANASSDDVEMGPSRRAAFARRRSLDRARGRHRRVPPLRP